MDPDKTSDTKSQPRSTCCFNGGFLMCVGPEVRLYFIYPQQINNADEKNINTLPKAKACVSAFHYHKKTWSGASQFELAAWHGSMFSFGK